MEDPNISKARDWFYSILHKTEVVRHSKISHLNFFPDPLQPSGWSSGAIHIQMGDPNISKARDWFFSKLHEREVVRHSKICHLKLFPDHPSNHLGGVLGPSLWGTQVSARPGTNFKAYSIEEILLEIERLVIWNFFLTPPDIWVEFWGQPKPHVGPQHQQGQGLILEYIS